MVKEHGLTVSLEEFGLSKYEAKAYVTLVSHGTISASEVAYYSNLPRTKVYPTLLKLEKKRLVIISKSKPIMCTAIAPEDAFDGIIQEHIDKVNQMNTLVTKLKNASEESKKTRGAEEKRYFHLSANNVLNQLKIMISGTKSSIQVIVDPWGLNLLAECKEQLLLVLRRNVDVKIIVSPTQLVNENGLGFILNSALDSKNTSIDMLKLLEKDGINLKSKPLDEVIEIINSALQITCSGHLNYDSAKNNITVESKLNGGHSLPWTTILDQYLHSCGYNTKLIYQNNSQKGEKIFIKIHPNKN